MVHHTVNDADALEFQIFLPFYFFNIRDENLQFSGILTHEQYLQRKAPTAVQEKS